MSSRHQKDATGPKKLNTKPEVKQVSLKPEEGVLRGCKGSGTTNGPNVGVGATCTLPASWRAMMS